jgi:methylase of polypeptide subunit release factors
MRAFVPPFRFTSFFSPEDTLLCMIAAEASLSHARSPGMSFPGSDPLRIAELTSGSGLIGLHLLRIERNSTLLGLDLDPTAAGVATANAEILALTRRARFTRADLKSRNTENLLLREKLQLLVCNPPYVPEPPGGSLPVEAGAGPDGTAHLVRALELARTVRPRAVALSWCSLSDPERVVREAERNGYRLNSLFVVLIADGEYSGSAGGYLRSLTSAFLNDSPETLEAVAPDGSASFGYLLMSGEFSRDGSGPKRRDAKASEQIRTICSRFARRGITILDSLQASFPVRVWLLDRWDELRLRAFLHGEVPQMSVTSE